MEVRQLVEIVIGGGEPRAALAGERDELIVHFRPRDLALVDLDAHLRQPLEALQDLEATLAPVAPQGVRRVGEPLELAEHEAWHDQRPVHEAGLAHVCDPPVDDRRGVQNLVVPTARRGMEEPA